jgi:dihydroorotate dehydrogenase
MYKLLRPVLFHVDPERIHHLTFSLLRFFGRIPGFNTILERMYNSHHPRLSQTLWGITFSNPVGLAAGFDKDAKIIDELASFGFGFIEIGTLTPKPQSGNDKPRLFRLPQDQALINRMGFNNEGVAAAVKRLKKRNANIVIGGNIGKNKSTANEEAVKDYLFCLEALFPYVDYFVVNVSSPNTPGLRSLQEKEPLQKLLSEVKNHSLTKPTPKPVLLKIAPDLSDDQLLDIVDILKMTGTDGVIATNTTIGRNALQTSAQDVTAIGLGGLSGKPLGQRSTDVIRFLRQKLGPEFPIIGVGGIMTPQDAREKLEAGANLIQIYTGFVYEGPGFVKRIKKFLAGT